MTRMQADFPDLLDCFSMETLELDSNSVYGLSVDLALNYLNPAWFSFAAENEGEPAVSERFGIGTRIADALSGSAREYYLDAFRAVLKTGKVWHHDYECSSPQKFRLYHQSVYPLFQRQGLVVVNSLVSERPFDGSLRSPSPPLIELYTRETGIIAQCSNCRRVQRASRPEVWDWVPEWVENMPDNISHSFCQICFEYYYEFKYRGR